MQIDEEVLREFVAAYKNAYDEELEDGEARLLLLQMAEFYLKVASVVDEDESQSKK